MAQKMDQAVFKGQQLRSLINNGQQNHPKRVLHGGHLVELVEDDIGNDILFQLNDNPHSLAIRLVAQIGNALNALLVDEVGNALNQARFIDLKRDFLDNKAALARSIIFLN